MNLHNISQSISNAVEIVKSAGSKVNKSAMKVMNAIKESVRSPNREIAGSQITKFEETDRDLHSLMQKMLGSNLQNIGTKELALLALLANTKDNDIRSYIYRHNEDINKAITEKFSTSSFGKANDGSFRGTTANFLLLLLDKGFQPNLDPSTSAKMLDFIGRYGMESFKYTDEMKKGLEKMKEG